jgi:drug/metabolite transporter (DMT)-like permease
MIAAGALFTCGDTLMKLATPDLETGQLIFMRGVFVCATALAVAYATGVLGLITAAFVPAVRLRSIGDVGGAFFFQSALARMPLADLMAVTQLNPLAITAASAIVLGEKVGWRRWTAAAAGLVGVLLIIRPGGSAFNWWALAGVAAVLSSTLRDLATTKITVAIPTVLIMVFSSGAVAIWGLVMALLETWRWPGPWLLLIVFGAAMFSMLGQICVIVAMRSGEVSAVAPFRYALILFALLMGFLVWGHFPDGLTLIGTAIVVGAGLYTFHREQTLRRRRVIGPPA